MSHQAHCTSHGHVSGADGWILGGTDKRNGKSQLARGGHSKTLVPALLCHSFQAGAVLARHSHTLTHISTMVTRCFSITVSIGAHCGSESARADTHTHTQNR